MRIRYISIVVVLLALGFGVGRLSAGSGTLDSPGLPGATSSYTLEDIYNRLDTGAEATKSTFTEPSAGPGPGTMHTLDEIYELIGERASVPRTGQTECWDGAGVSVGCTGTGQDGEYQKGVAWPNPRFTDNGNGTVTDNLTGLIWLRNANCFGQRTWTQALSDANGLTAGYCGLTDGSSAGDWRRANVMELQSLAHYGYYDPALPNTAGTGQWTEGDPFTGVQSEDYWSSTTDADYTFDAWSVHMYYGAVILDDKSFTDYVWPVRGG